MKIILDGDACPQKEEIVNLAHQYHKKVILFIDYAHQCYEELYDDVIYCDVGHDSCDMLIANRIEKDDLLITQDYGLASLALMKQAKVLHVSGKMIHLDNIDELLYRRYGSAKLRKAKQHLKGIKSRNEDTKRLFIKQLEVILKER